MDIIFSSKVQAEFLSTQVIQQDIHLMEGWLCTPLNHVETLKKEETKERKKNTALKSSKGIQIKTGVCVLKKGTPKSYNLINSY